MKVLILIKDGKLASYPSDILVDNEVRKSYNLEFECEKLKVTHVVGKSIPSILIKKLRDKGIVFIKLNSLDEIDELDLDVTLKSETKIKRGSGCQSRFNTSSNLD